MRRTSRTLVLALLATVSGIACAGDTLLIQRVQEETGNLPMRGLRMAQVEARFGAPAERLDRRGGQKQAWPVIDRWVYPAFTVYFEKGRVIDAVANKAGADEIGPKPAAR